MAFGYYKTVTIDHTQCGGSNSSDFPVSIYVIDPDLKTVGNGGYVQNAFGYDIRPYADSGATTPLTYEAVAYGPTTGMLEMHVKIPTLDASSNVVFYLFFGDSGISTDGSSTATWSNNFAAVYHLPNGTILSANDSTGNGHTGTISNATPTAAVLNGGASFVAASSAYIDCGNTVDTGTRITLSASIKSSAFETNGQIVCNDDNLRVYQFRVDGTPALQFIPFDSGGSPISVVGATTLSTDTWYRVGGVVDGSNAIAYLNGASDASSAMGNLNNPVSSFDYTVLGARGHNGVNGNFFGGIIDEVRIASVGRSSAWMLAEANNVKPSSTFLAFGALTPVGGGATWPGYISPFGWR